MRRFGYRSICFVLLVGLLCFGSIGASDAAPRHHTFKVTTTDDFATCLSRSYCSLRGAIALAHPGDTIKIPAGFYRLTVNSPLTIDKRLTLVGAGADATDIVGNVPGQTSFTQSVFSLGSAAVVTLKNLSVQGGHPTADGGGINNAGTARLIGVSLTGNIAHDNGGAIFNTGTLSLRSTRLVDNTAGASGGAIDNGGVLSMTKSTVDHNASGSGTTFGGGIYNSAAGTATITSSSITNNTSPAFGGGLANFHSLTLNRSRVSGNTASGVSATGGGIYNQGDIHISQTTVGDNVAAGTGAFGGGLASDGGTVNVSRSTFSGNTAPGGGGFYLTAVTPGPATIVNSTISENSASSGTGGGLLEVLSDVGLTSDTIAKNSSSVEGGGIEGSGGTITLRATVIGENLGIDPDCNATPAPTSQGFNFVQDEGSNCAIVAGPHDNLNSMDDPNLGGLAFNGGPTETMALPKNASAAVRLDAQDPTCNGHTRDQRGHRRPRHRCDSGAFQVTK